jgi:hypothetical protein
MRAIAHKLPIEHPVKVQSYPYHIAQAAADKMNHVRQIGQRAARTVFTSHWVRVNVGIDTVYDCGPGEVPIPISQSVQGIQK